MPTNDSPHTKSDRERFDDWLEEVDKNVDSLCGMSIEDLPDIDYWLFWTTGVSPRDTARKAIHNAGGY